MADIKNPPKHPFLDGNFAPVSKQLSLEPCEIQGTIPDELIGGQYVRNSSNPLPHGDPRRALHWFDGHGMLHAVYFNPSKSRAGNGSDVQPLFSNQYVLTDVFLAESKSRKGSPILPSIATLIDPASSLLTILRDVLRTLWVVLCSWMGHSLTPIKRISVANTNIISHNGRILAMCESGPPMRVSLPDLKTVGWFDGCRAEGEPDGTERTVPGSRFTDNGLLSFFREWTTAHPHIDPRTGEMLLFHSTFVRPFVRYSIQAGSSSTSTTENELFGRTVPGVPSPKMMHDFGVSRRHTVIIDMPLSLNPLDLAHNKPVVLFNPKGETRFGVFPRYMPQEVQWFSTEACCIFHTVNTWDEVIKADTPQTTVNMLVCRMTGPTMVYASGNIPVPSNQATLKEECRLYYYQFAVEGANRTITQQWALSAIPFEFPHVPDLLAVSATRFVYGCSVGRGDDLEDEYILKIGSLAKANVQKLISRGLKNPPAPVSGCVDDRSVEEVLASGDPDDPIQIFVMPEGFYAQECVFVPRKGGDSEDDGWLLTFVFDESQLDAEGNAPDDAKGELWIIDAKTMKDVVARVQLPQRVPYGLHGTWFSKDEIAQQRPVKEFRSCPL